VLRRGSSVVLIAIARRASDGSCARKIRAALADVANGLNCAVADAMKLVIIVEGVWAGRGLVLWCASGIAGRTLVVATARRIAVG